MRKAILFFIIAIIFVSFIVDCSKNPVSQEASESAGDGLVLNALYKKDLIADRTTWVGKIGLDFESTSRNNYLIVRFAVLSDWTITETHVYIGETPPANNDFWKFPYKHEGDDIGSGAHTDFYGIPTTNTSWSNLYFAAHAVVKGPDGKEKSAWAKGEVEFTQDWGWYTQFDPTRGTVTDIDGNVYQTVKIGDQWWMAENLKATHYRSGDPIPNITDGIEWFYLTTGAYCNYDNDTAYVDTYGRLYNWYAVGDSRNIAPEGWHVPTDEDWKQLEMFLGMSRSEADRMGFRGTDEGGKLKETGNVHWESFPHPDGDATNESGFTALPGGFRIRYSSRVDTVFYFELGYYAFFWSSTVDSIDSAWDRSVGYYYSGILRAIVNKRRGYSIRCVRD